MVHPSNKCIKAALHARVLFEGREVLAFVFTCLVDFWMVSGLHLQDTCSCDACFNFGTKDRGEQQHDTVYVSWASRSVSAGHICKGMFHEDIVDCHW